jgi:hypothetical protein
MATTGPPVEDSGDDAGKFKGEEQHGWAPDVGKEGSEEGHQASEKSFEGKGDQEG